MSLQLCQYPLIFSTDDICAGTQPSGVACTCVSANQSINCTFDGAETAQIFIEPKEFTAAEYNVSTMVANGSNGADFTANNINFLKIREDEIFHTLVEFGRGRGNYFFDSLGRTSSASTGTGFPYVPNSTRFELNYLHKVFNIKQYFGLSGIKAENASFTCVYPNNTVVRVHLDESISRNDNFIANYKIPEIGGSFERQSFLGQDFDAAEVPFNTVIPVNCTGLSYVLEEAGGNITVKEDSFNLTARNKEPFTFSAAENS